MDLEQLKYPIGRFIMPEVVDGVQIREWISEIESLPEKIKQATAGLTAEQLNQSYRPGGWTLRQVVHHIPDSHMNAYMRFKLALTEDVPVIRPYEEKRWAETAEAKTGAIQMSVDLLISLHQRWVALLRGLHNPDFQRRYIHPEHRKELNLEHMLGMYAWHGKHHLAQITNTKF